MYLVFTRMSGESYCWRLRSLWLCLCVTSFERWLTPLFVDSGLTYEKSFEMGTDDRVRPVLTLYGWQDIKIQLLTVTSEEILLLLLLRIRHACVLSFIPVCAEVYYFLLLSHSRVCLKWVLCVCPGLCPVVCINWVHVGPYSGYMWVRILGIWRPIYWIYVYMLGIYWSIIYWLYVQTLGICYSIYWVFMSIYRVYVGLYTGYVSIHWVYVGPYTGYMCPYTGYM